MAIAHEDKINAIGAYREETGAGLVESKAAIERLQRALYREAAPAAPPQP